MYIHRRAGWPDFRWDATVVTPLLAKSRYAQGHLLGKLTQWGFSLQVEASFDTIVKDVITNSQIEGEILPQEQVRSSVAHKLGLEFGGLVAVDRHVDGVVEMMLDATQHYDLPLTHERLFGWQAALFPTGRSGLVAIQAGHYREHPDTDPMQVVSGGFGRPRVHFEAPSSGRIGEEMERLLSYVNNDVSQDPLLKAALAHLWFLTIHPFDDGNGRVARALTDLLLARSDKSKQRFYSMSSAILADRKNYYRTLELTQKGDLDVTEWLCWFCMTLEQSLQQSGSLLEGVARKARFWQAAATHKLNDRQRLMLNRILDGFRGNVTSSKWAKIAKVSQDTATRDIKDLVSKRILRRAPAGGRSTHYLLVE